MKKILSVLLALAMTASLLGGCMCETADTTLYADGSGVMAVRFGFSAELVDALDMRSDMANQGFAYFVYNGRGYYGDSAEQSFADAAEFNALFAEVSDQASEVSAAAAPAALTLSVADDGGLTLTVRNTMAAREDAIADELRDKLPDYSESELSALLEGMVMTFRFTFPEPLVRYSSGAGITVDGSTVTLDCLTLASGTYQFTTSHITRKTLGTVTPESIPASGTAQVRRQSIEIDGSAITFQTYALVDDNGGETNYVRLRDIASALDGTAAQFAVTWNGNVVIEPLSAYSPNGSEMQTPFSGGRAYTVSNAATMIYGEAIPFTAITLTDDNGGGYTYYKLRDLGKVLGFYVGWAAERGIYIESATPYGG